LFRAYFLDARDIGDHQVLAEIAAAVGLSPESDQATHEVRTEEEWARRQGIQGVPFFIVGGGAATISGAQKPETMAASMQNALAAFAPPNLRDDRAIARQNTLPD
jgi:predicted DsbA family dithiol-disulfide isomerase